MTDHLYHNHTSHHAGNRSIRMRITTNHLYSFRTCLLNKRGSVSTRHAPNDSAIAARIGSRSWLWECVRNQNGRNCIVLICRKRYCHKKLTRDESHSVDVRPTNCLVFKLFCPNFISSLHVSLTVLVLVWLIW